MKTTAFLIFYAGVLITLDSGVVASKGVEEESRKAKGVREEVPPPRPSFPLLTLPSFSSFSLPGLNLPYLQGFSQPNRLSSPERVRQTKTEYVEVTRRQTVHPVCYTAYEAKSPCLPYAQTDFHEDDYDDVVHQTHDSFNLNEVKSVGSSEVSDRTGKYLEVKLRRDSGMETSTRIEGSEFFPSLNRIPPRQPVTDYQTKTVLITKLEKYTDRRVTATLVAINCLPVDRSIPMCQSYPNPIREAPDSRSDDFQPPSLNPTQTIAPTFNKGITKPTGVVEPADVYTEDTLLSEE